MKKRDSIIRFLISNPNKKFTYKEIGYNLNLSATNVRDIINHIFTKAKNNYYLEKELGHDSNNHELTLVFYNRKRAIEEVKKTNAN